MLVAKIDAVQSEYSAFETLHETNGVIDTCKELGVAYVAYSPLGHGVLVDDFQYKSPDDFAPDDFRRTCKFSLAHYPHNLPKYVNYGVSNLWLDMQRPSFREKTFTRTWRLWKKLRNLQPEKGALRPRLPLLGLLLRG